MQATNNHPLTLERLDARDLPSATISQAGAHLLITGDDSANAVVVRDDGHGHITASITSGGSTITTKAAGVSKVVINTLGGDDSLDYRLTGNLLVAEELDVDLGAGNDRAYIDLYRGLSGVPYDLEWPEATARTRSRSVSPRS